jgi:DNA-binding transcriptional regulator PaaX
MISLEDRIIQALCLAPLSTATLAAMLDKMPMTLRPKLQTMRKDGLLGIYKFINNKPLYQLTNKGLERAKEILS